MAVVHVWVGAVTSSGAWVRGKVTGASVRLAVSANPDLSSPTFFGPVTPTADGIASINATGRAADTQYYYAFEVDGALDLSFSGKFHTHGAIDSPYSFTFAAGGDAGVSGADIEGNLSPYITNALSNHPVFDTVRQANPLFMVHLGDMHYRNITSGLVADYRTAFDDVLTFNGTLGANARQGMLYRNVPLVYMWDDHDYSGNNSTGAYTGKAAPATTYRERVPSYPLAEGSAIYHSFKVGRVQFIVTDSRFYRDPTAATPTMLGAAQLTWLQNILATSTSKFLVFCTQLQWMSTSTDSWGGFTAERDQIAGWLTTYGWTNRMVMLNADKHSLGMETGATNNVWGHFPVYLLASFDCGGGDNTGPYDLGITGGRNRYGLVNVADAGDRITVTTNGYTGTDVYATHSVTVLTPVAAPVSTDPIIEVQLGDKWTDISGYVLQRDKVTITRGRADETSATQPGTCTFTVNNTDGRFSPRNPNGPYFGLIGRNTPVRVSMVRNGVQYSRFYGEISAWPVKWDTSGNDVYVSVTAGGLLRRLGQGNSPIKSVITRDMTRQTRRGIVAYWPMEEIGGTSFGSALPGKPALRISSGSPDFASYGDWYGSDSLPAMQTARVSGPIATYTSLGQISVRFFIYLPDAPTNSPSIMRLSTNGDIRLWELNTNPTGDLRLKATGDDGTTVYDSGDAVYALIGRMCMITLELSQNTADITTNIVRTTISNGNRYNFAGDAVTLSGTITGQKIGVATGVELTRGGNAGGIVIGHLSVANDLTAYANSSNALDSWNDEPATIRFKRLCDEEGITREVIFSPTYAGNTTTLGNQRVKTLVDLFADIAESNHGMLYESRTQLALGYRDRLSLYNQPADITLSYSGGDLSGDLEPVEDDQGLVNDVTATRDAGASARFEVKTGRLSVAPPPAGVGRYDAQATLSLGFDYQAYPQAGWIAHLGTVDEARYPTVTLDLSMPPYANSVSKTAAVFGLDVGDRIVITDLPDWLPPGDVTLLIQGYTETLDRFQPKITYNCTPEVAWHVGAIEDATYSRLDSGSSTVYLPVGISDTALKVATPDQLWSTAASDVPFKILVNGEEMTVTAVSGAASPQTFTVTRATNGIAKAHAVGEAVALSIPTVIAL